MRSPRSGAVAKADIDYDVRAAELVQEAKALAMLSARQMLDLQWAIASLFRLGDSAWAVLQNSPWTALELRGDPGDLRHPWDQLSGKRQAKGRRNAFERFRANQTTFDYCGVARDAILRADWPRAVCAVLTAGNSSQGDLAVIGNVRRKGLTKPGGPKPIDPKIVERNAAIIRRAAAMRTKNAALRASAIARKLAGKAVDGHQLPRYDMVRKILGRNKSWEVVS